MLHTTNLETKQSLSLSSIESSSRSEEGRALLVVASHSIRYTHRMTIVSLAQVPWVNNTYILYIHVAHGTGTISLAVAWLYV